jgi:hypothetical protein
VLYSALDERAAKLVDMSNEELRAEAEKAGTVSTAHQLGNLQQQKLLKKKADADGENLADKARSAL